MPYQPIENYGLVGNMQTVALVGLDSSIDWFCFPRFDSPSVFAAILDDRKGGRFKITPQSDEVTYRQHYWPDTNVLLTKFYCPVGIARVMDFMPVDLKEGEHGYHGLIRVVEAIRGTMTFRMDCRPAFNYGRDEHRTTVVDQGATFHSPGLNLALDTKVPLKQDDRGVFAEFALREGEKVAFVLSELHATDGCHTPLTRTEGEALFEQTVGYWRSWLAKCTYTGRWREMVQRSALTLKMLTFEPTGAIVAAPTCSLPEGIGGERNWDYRYTWIRDAAFTLYGLMRIGFMDEAAKFMQWIEGRCHELKPDGSLQIMYGIDGRHELTEETLDHFEGYRQSRPVRIGNGAYDQMQLDIYGELMDSVYLYNKYGEPISYDLWTHLRRLINWVCENWKRTDEGIWEVRGGQQHFVYSKLMCWVAVDRGLRLAQKRSFPADWQRWLNVRDEIYQEIMAQGWSSSRQAFVQRYGSDSLDAANLMMPLVMFVAPSDPRMLKTLDETNKVPEQGGLVANSLVYRYNVSETVDGLRGHEGTFNICTFWLVEAMTRAGRVEPERLERARLLFEQMLGYANHLGLYAEEIGHHGEALGNFPQAFTHLALISAAFNLDRALGKGG